MKDRLAQFLKSESLTAVKFAEIMEVQPSSISHLLSGRNKPNFEFISRMLLRFPDLNPDWMINGIGPVYRSEQKEISSVITGVTKGGITNVKSSPSPTILQDSKDIRQGDVFENVSKISPSNDKDGEVTNVTNNGLEFVASSEPEVSPAGSKLIERVIIFYSDGSFREYHN
ncbi:MAG: helix-turn-helix transcriptional regulator [Rikenellaceae bacterium]|nr:helix-turn-helix transcriptional regulator [Rikenellaceae bacterium]